MTGWVQGARGRVGAGAKADVREAHSGPPLADLGTVLLLALVALLVVLSLLCVVVLGDELAVAAP